MNFLSRLWLYLLSKISEVKHLDYKDVLAAALITEIKAKKISEKSQFVRIEKLAYLHKIDRENAIKNLHEREKIIKVHKHELMQKKNITKKWLVKYFPSITHFKVVSYGDGFVVYEGNGRMMAIKNVIGSGVKIEVDVITVRGSVDGTIRKVRRVNGLE